MEIIHSSLFSSDRRIIDLNSKDMFSIESFSQLQKIAESRIDVKNRIIRDFHLIDTNSITRNRSLYEDPGYTDALFNSVFINEKLRRGTLFGEFGHPPPDCTRERFMKVDYNNVDHKHINFRKDGMSVYGDIQYVKPKGDITWDWIEKGSNIGISTRILTPNYEQRTDEKGNPYIHKFGKMRFITFDTVDIPGDEASGLVDLHKYDASRENWEGIHLNWTKDRKKEEFLNLLRSQESADIMQEIYGFDMKNVKNIAYSNEGLITIELDNTKNYKRSIKIPTNVYKVNQVLCSGL